MSGYVVELVCDRGVWHERKDGQRRYWVLARFTRRSERSDEGVLWEIEAGRKCPQGDGVEALRWQYNAPKYKPVEYSLDDPAYAELSKIRGGNYSFPPCPCGFPSPEQIGVSYVERALEDCRNKGKTRVTLSEFLALAVVDKASEAHYSDTHPMEATLCTHAPADGAMWQRFRSELSSGSRLTPEPPLERDFIQEGQAFERRIPAAMSVFCDGGTVGKAWHKRHGTTRLAILEHTLDEEAEPPAPVIVDELISVEWSLTASEGIDTETLGGLAFLPCACGRRDLPVLDLKKSARVVARLHEANIRFVTVDELAYLVKHA